jgi:hypothetical protein
MWTTLATRREDTVFEDDEAMMCDFSPDTFGDVAGNTIADQFFFDGFIM